MECETCKYWEKHRLVKVVVIKRGAEWGDCRLLASGDADKIDIYSNKRDGEWVETHVETLLDFFCACYEKGE